jgi:hypothetical protein
MLNYQNDLIRIDARWVLVVHSAIALRMAIAGPMERNNGINDANKDQLIHAVLLMLLLLLTARLACTNKLYMLSAPTHSHAPRQVDEQQGVLTFRSSGWWLHSNSL